MTGLRTIWGISLEKIQDDFGITFNQNLLKSVQPYIEKNLLEIKDGKIIATQKGKFLIDGIASDLFMI
jgi:oxygen-independent coproporphyrinogen III oxidase